MLGEENVVEALKESYGFADWPRPEKEGVIQPLPLLPHDRLPLPFIERSPFYLGYQDMFGETKGPLVMVRVQRHPTVTSAQEALLVHVARSMAPRVPLGSEQGLDIGDVSITGHVYEDRDDALLSVTFARLNILVDVSSVGEQPYSVDEFARTIDEAIR